jgi:hypothetical protein
MSAEIERLRADNDQHLIDIEEYRLDVERLQRLLRNIPLMVEKWETAHIDPDGTIHYSGIGKQIARDIRDAIGGEND